jgi:MFS superfamily sulfate permease-like transporter
LPPQVGMYGYLLGGLGYALLGSSRQLVIGPTSAISLMIAGTVGAMAGGEAVTYGLETWTMPGEPQGSSMPHFTRSNRFDRISGFLP